MEKFIDDLREKNLLPKLFGGKFGIEIEEHRIDKTTGHLSRVPHAKELGDRKRQKHFQTDFSESMEEVITDPMPDVEKTISQLHDLQSILFDNLDESETIWPLSMPPRMNDDDLKFLQNSFERPWYQKYRDQLIEKYGLYQHIMTGIHIAYSPSNKIVDEYQQFHQFDSNVDAKNQLLFQIAQHLVGYRFIFTYLYGASPVSENVGDTIPALKRKWQPVTSWRSSRYGFVNKKWETASYINFDELLDQINEFIKKNKYYASTEFYGPVRLKSENPDTDLMNYGADYVEFRTFDDDPFSLDGVTKNQMYFFQLMVMDAILNHQEWDADKLKKADKVNNEIAMKPASKRLPPKYQEYVDDLLKRFDAIVSFAPMDLKLSLNKSIISAKKALLSPRLTISGKLEEKLDRESLMGFGIKRAEDIKHYFDEQTDAQKFPQVDINKVDQYVKDMKRG